MRSLRLLTPLALLIPFAGAAPASAAETFVDVVDFEFRAKTVQIEPGDTVTWRFANGGHTTTSAQGFERWDSGSRAASETYSRAFAKAGKYRYLCTPHAPSMSGVVQVGIDEVATTFRRAKATGLRRAVRLSLTLNEEAAITWAVKGETRKKVKKRYRSGRVRQTIRTLKPGRYSVKVTAVDRFADRSTKTVRFRVKD